MFRTLMRISEALAISDADIYYDKKIITVSKHVIHDGNRPIPEEKTKIENSKRTIILLDRLAEKLPNNKKGLLFGNEDGTPLTKRQLACRWENLKARKTPHKHWQNQHLYGV